MIPKKHLGQHFLTAPSYARKIAEALPGSRADALLEIGPGQGALSIFLKERFPDFHCVEVDAMVIELLRLKLGDGFYTVHYHDVLTFDFGLAGFPLHVVGNLPYSIGAPIIKKTLYYGKNIHSCTFMMQREVVQRIVAPPHCRTRGFLSVFCSFFGTPRLLFNVPPGAFFPRPKVESSVFQIVIDNDPEKKLPQARWEPFFALVSRGFQQRRKKVVNSLSADGRQKERIAAILRAHGVNGDARSEDLDCSQWLNLYKALC
ncbi:MAG: ribosomal RNA small subunit methyltransferase A [Chitinispirillaceae bacterium]|nr:ribosomal RNA small subunit methyltransferase A [Chitinispirillaceae bacterium]